MFSPFLTGEARFPSFFIHKKITRLEVSKLQVGDTSTKIVYFFSHLDFSMRPLVHRNALAIIDTKTLKLFVSIVMNTNLSKIAKVIAVIRL